MYCNGNIDKKEQKGRPSQYPQGYFKKKPCKGCGITFSPNTPAELYCSDICKDIAANDKYLRRTYGIGLEEYRTFHEPGVCEICGSEGFVLNKHSKIKLCLDHDHATGEVRGILCHNCNRGLGLFQDSASNLENAVAYLERAETIPKGSTPELVEAQATEIQ